MSQPPSLHIDEAHSIRPGRVVLGVLFALGWMGVHLVLFYLFFASGFLLELAVQLVKKIMFNLPDGPLSGDGSADLAWTGILQVGLVLAGLAGVPAGLAIFLRSRRKMLMRLFWLSLLAGFICECSFVISLLRSVFAS